jgi:hypothetical protein
MTPERRRPERALAKKIRNAADADRRSKPPALRRTSFAVSAPAAPPRRGDDRAAATVFANLIFLQFVALA